MKRTVNKTLLKELIKEKGMDCVVEKGVSVHTLHKMAYGDYESEPKGITIMLICDAYNVEKADLFPAATGDSEAS